MNGAELITVERKRQVEEEDYTDLHDDGHDVAEIIEAAIAYAVAAHDQVTEEENLPDGPPGTWPWHSRHWKRSDDPVRNLVKAGALIAAEIDRLQRKKTQ